MKILSKLICIILIIVTLLLIINEINMYRINNMQIDIGDNYDKLVEVNEYYDYVNKYKSSNKDAINIANRCQQLIKDNYIEKVLKTNKINSYETINLINQISNLNNCTLDVDEVIINKYSLKQLYKSMIKPDLYDLSNYEIITNYDVNSNLRKSLEYASKQMSRVKQTLEIIEVSNKNI